MGCTLSSDADKEAMKAHEALVIDLLRTAAGLGRVVIVTMAIDCWIRLTLDTLMPGLPHVLQELGIEIVRARDTCARWRMRSAFVDNRDPSHFLKAESMKRVITKFYNTGYSKFRIGARTFSALKTRSWKNVLSIGDSRAERYALQDVVFQHKQRKSCNDSMVCRCKTLLMIDSPNLEQLGEEVKLIKTVLPKMVHYDGDVDLDLAERDLLQPLTCSVSPLTSRVPLRYHLIISEAQV
jgi:hypothetical protein